jgi:NAD(P)-dependent dehydrogenase (short-subunit alcohol dehydrogenase family)
MLENAFNKFDLTGKTAVVTGGGTGLGFAITRALLQSGATVLIMARREAVLKAAVERLRDELGCDRVLYLTVDLADRESVDSAATQAVELLGGVDIYVANAAQEINQAVDAIEYEAVDRMLQVNVAANISLVKLFLPHMRQNRWGRFIFISSIASKLASAQEKASLYCSTKAALNAYARVAAAEVGHDRITFNNINPGMYRTEMLEQLLDDLHASDGVEATEQFIRDASSSTALGRFGKCEEIEGAIQLLASDAGSYITGADITIDGGMSIMLKPNPV